MEFVISQDISESGVCQSFFIFLICILLPSDPQSVGNCPHGFGRERGELCCAAWEDAEILRAFFVHAPTFELRAFPRDFFWSSVAQISAWDWPSFLSSGTLIALDLGP